MRMKHSCSNWMRLRALLLALAIFSAPTRLAFAADAQKAAADQLFDDAKKLMEAGNYKEACPKLAQSQLLDPGEGTFLRLAFCYENLGRLATAWTMYREGLAKAKKSGNTQRVEFATKQIAGVEPRLSKVTVVIAAPTAGLEVKWDGSAFVAGTAIPVDGGTHVLSVTAPGKKPWETKVEIAPEKDVKIVDVPALEDAPTTTDSPANASLGTSKVGPIVAFSAAGIFLGGAIVSRIVMGGAKDDYTARCSAQTAPGACADEDGKSKVRTWEALSFVGAGLGLAALGTGIVLLATGAPSEEKSALVVTPTVGLSNGVAVMGAF